MGARASLRSLSACGDSVRRGIGYWAVRPFTIQKKFVLKLLGTAEYGLTLLDGEDGIASFKDFTYTY